MVEHAEELVKVAPEHDEVKRALEPIFDQGPLELVNVWEYKLFIVLVKLDERPSDERDVMPLIFLRNGDLGRCLTLNVSLGSCFDLLGKLMDLHFLTLADLNNLNRRVFNQFLKLVELIAIVNFTIDQVNRQLSMIDLIICNERLHQVMSLGIRLQSVHHIRIQT